MLNFHRALHPLLHNIILVHNIHLFHVPYFTTLKFDLFLHINFNIYLEKKCSYSFTQYEVIINIPSTNVTFTYHIGFCIEFSMH